MADRYHLLPVSSLLARHITKAGDCWLWTGRLYPNGYGQFHVRRKVVYAHIASYEIHVGTVPAGLELDHTCRNRACVNPEHLEPVTHEVNVRRGNAVKVACPQGHPYSAMNTNRDKNGWPHCRICQRERGRKRSGGQRGPYRTKYNPFP